MLNGIGPKITGKVLFATFLFCVAMSTVALMVGSAILGAIKLAFF